MRFPLRSSLAFSVPLAVCALACSSSTGSGVVMPRATLVVSDPNTVAPIRAINALLRRHCPFWTYREIAEGGHMAPLTRPEMINPIVRSFLSAPLKPPL